jgi:hypothetical protein
MEDTMLESFTQLGYDVDMVELVKQAETILDPIPEMQLKCGEITELSFPTPYSSAIQPLDLIFESKWVGAIHVWPRWPSVTVGTKKDKEWFSTGVQIGWQGYIDYSKMKDITRKDHFPLPFFDQFMKWIAGYPYFYVFGSYSNYNHYSLDLGKPEHTSLTVALGVSTYCCWPVGFCNSSFELHQQL